VFLTVNTALQLSNIPKKKESVFALKQHLSTMAKLVFLAIFQSIGIMTQTAVKVVLPSKDTTPKLNSVRSALKQPPFFQIMEYVKHALKKPAIMLNLISALLSIAFVRIPTVMINY
jgi:hypothetical protein